MRPLPLRLALHPLLALRTPATEDCFEHGFRLRLPGGPALTNDDPLLAAFGASVEWLRVDVNFEEALQADAFEPGRLVRLVAEPFDPDDRDVVGVWDDEGLRNAGTVPEPTAALVAAGTQVGLEYRALVLCELRGAGDDRREQLCVLVFAPALVRVRLPRTPGATRPVRPVRPRLVLVADASGDVRWWDPSATNGPLAASDLPLSQELRRDLARLRDDFAAHAADVEGQRGFERVESDWVRDRLQSTAADLWRRARSEIGHRYVVGFLGDGMRRPVWAPSELCGEHDGSCDIPF